MGIGITSNRSDMGIPNPRTSVSIPNGDRHYLELRNKAKAGDVVKMFQSPMGIGITSNIVPVRRDQPRLNVVSIPNGDRHYLEPCILLVVIIGVFFVSIPNGDRHYLELIDPILRRIHRIVSIPNGDRHYLEPLHISQVAVHGAGFNPQWG